MWEEEIARRNSVGEASKKVRGSSLNPANGKFR